MQRLESSIQRSVIGWAKKRGLRCDKLSSGSHFQTSGLPDFIIWLPGGRPLLIEFKTETGQVSPLQARTHDQFRALGYVVEVVRSTEEGKKIITEAVEVGI